MPVPYGRKSRSKSRMQRSANMKYKGVHISFCEVCGYGKIFHSICKRCKMDKKRFV